MKFLFDQSADFRLIPYLTGRGDDVQAISRDYPAGTSDDEVLAIATRERRILITADLDFGELVVRERRPHAGVILMRLPGMALPAKIARLEAVLADFAHELDRLLVVSEHTVRVR